MPEELEQEALSERDKQINRRYLIATGLLCLLVLALLLVIKIKP
jgi:hypothetical protein